MAGVTGFCYRHMGGGHTNRKNTVVTGITLLGKFIKDAADMARLAIQNSMRTFQRKTCGQVIKCGSLLLLLVKFRNRCIG